MKINLFWFRRDLRLQDNTALSAALRDGLPVLPIFIFDPQILDELPKNDARVQFIHEELYKIDSKLKENWDGYLSIIRASPTSILKQILNNYEVQGIYFNKDYEPYTRERDAKVISICENSAVRVNVFSDQYIFEPGDILKTDGKPYTVFTPFKNRWLEQFNLKKIQISNPSGKFLKRPDEYQIPALEDIGFKPNIIKVKPYHIEHLANYADNRNNPSSDGTSHLSPHLRFGTVSIRRIVIKCFEGNPFFLSELIWREFFMHILYFFPQVTYRSFKPKYEYIPWRNNMKEFEAWCAGKTGYPFVDAGMRELNETGYMHNRVRMISASFLCKHLLIDWRLGEAYFAKKLLDFELASNNGNWQWVAGSGCDAAPYFRIFNPISQLEKFDQERIYVKRWISELDSENYPSPIVNHKEARKRAIDVYKNALNS